MAATADSPNREDFAAPPDLIWTVAGGVAGIVAVMGFGAFVEAGGAVAFGVGAVATAVAAAAGVQAYTGRFEIRRGRTAVTLRRGGMLFKRSWTFERGTLDAIGLVEVGPGAEALVRPGGAMAGPTWRLEARGGPGAYRVIARADGEAALAPLARALAEALKVPFEVERA